ncbi:MAG: hypothetical protein GAK31_01742 [Stenotrophomonas maltophilia]|uniref:Lipoprotein n=1 Tax=Stenotrophomonas maltophilia TaxID=40324 RepID=A0A7V8FIA0_STEMA|nr:MAG: hypothetical protein GAK31_01742 [Stenotrophomonas maltophilia]
MKLKLSVALFCLAALSGCTTAKMTVTPDGRRGVSIDCSGGSSWGACYEKAGQVYPGGYDVFSKDGDDGNKIAVGNKNGFTSTQIATRSMLVGCK